MASKMMPNDWGRLVKSRQFKFIVGPDKDEFMVHSAAFTKLSSYFQTLMNGEMAEARSGEVVWDDVEVDTFVHLSQFAYYGDYSISEPSNEDNSDDREETPAPSSTASGRTAADFQQRFKEQDKARAEFDGRLKEKGVDGPTRLLAWYEANKNFPESPIKEVTDFVLLETFYNSPQATQSKNSGAAAQQPQDSNTQTLDSAQVSRQCLAHVKVYVLGDRYMIDSLRGLALRKMHSALLQTELTAFSGVGSIADMIRYAFEKTAEGDDLRALLISYGTTIYDVYMFHPDFWQVLRDVGELPANILKKRLYPFTN